VHPIDASCRDHRSPFIGSDRLGEPPDRSLHESAPDVAFIVFATQDLDQCC